jgi:hypothetical protein
MEGAVDPCLAVDGRGCEGGLIYSGDRAARLGLVAIMPMTDLRGGGLSNHGKIFLFGE